MYQYITQQSNTFNLFPDLKKSQIIGLDIETTKLDPFTSTILLLQIEANNQIYLLDFRKINLNFFKGLLQIINDSKITCVGHNIKFDIKHLFVKTGELLTRVYDTMVAEVLINQGVGKQYYSYGELVEKYFNIELSKDVRDSFIDFEGNLTNEQLNYSAIDIKFLREIRDLQLLKLNEQGQGKVIDLESKLVPVVASMELNGVLINKDYWLILEQKANEDAENVKGKLINTVFDYVHLDDYSDAYELSQALAIPVRTKKLTTELQNIKDIDCTITWTKENLNISSPLQMKAILNLVGVSVDSTGEKVIKKYSHELIDLLLDYREKDKRRTTYGSNFIDEINPVTGRFHADYNQVGTVTGRFSVPRLHQIPRDATYRKGFIARPEYKILTADYSQQEYRLVGAVTGEPKIIDAYKKGIDLHTLTASIVYKIPVEEVTKEQRTRAKNINFAILYWSSEYGLAHNLDVPLEEAIDILNMTSKEYPRFMKYRELMGDAIWEHKMSSTKFGRKRFWKEKTLFIDNKEYERYKRKVQREGFNLIIQGLAGDITKLALLYIFYTNPFGELLKLYMQVHDEIVTEVHESIAEDAKIFVKDCMLKAEQPFLGEIPAEVDLILLDYWTKG